MTTTRKLTELFRALAAEDVATASAHAAQLVKLEEKKGHTTIARVLRGALANGNGSMLGDRGLSSRPPETANVFSGALVRLTESKRMVDVVLTPDTRAQLSEVVLEWRHRDILQRKGVPPRSKFLFHGPPGCGKSLTAQALGFELGVPVYMVRFDAVIGAFLGQTAIHLRQLFHFAETTPCVLLLDELDALGKRRGNPLDVGELDRIVISLLQELEHSRPRGIVIGTTNLPHHLDDALWRRFDIDLAFKAPNRPTLRAFVTQLASRRKVKLPRKVVDRAARAKSFAGAERAVMDEIRKQTLAATKAK